MAQLLQFTLLGLAAGSLYALTAHGLVLVYKSSGVLNFAQGAFGMVGAYVYYRVGVDHGWSAPVRLGVALVVPALLGAATHLLLMRRLRRASPLVRLVATLGVLFLLLAIANSAFGDTGQFVTSPLTSAVAHPFGKAVTIGADRLWIIAISIAVTAVLSLVYRYTSLGRRTEAVAENPRAAAALGYSPDVVAVVNWALAGTLSACGAILIAPILLLQPTTLAFVVLFALAAALLGGFTSFWRTLAGALAIGVIEALVARYVEHVGILTPITSKTGLLFGAFSAQAVSQSIAFLVIVGVLTVRGRALPARGELLDRLPALGDGRIRWPATIATTAVAAIVIVSVPDVWVSALTVTMATSIILLSLVVVTGYVGQLSLAQVSLAGVGAWAAGRLVEAQHWPFVPALAVGVGAAALIGAGVAVPALRTRGMNLAVLTFGLSVCLVDLVLSNPALTGGLAGTSVGGITLLGIRIDPFDLPSHYALVVLAALVIAGIVVANLRRGPTGRRLIAVRSNERAAAALGIDVPRTKLYAFALGAGLAALGGILLAFAQQTIAYASFATLASIQAVVFIVIGGVGYVLGAVVGATLAPGGLGAQIADAIGVGANTLQIVSGCLLILTVLAHPDGVAHTPSRWLRWRSARRAEDSPPRAHPTEAEFIAPAAPAPRTLVVTGLTVRFGGVVAVDDVSLRIHPGEVLGIIGPNGAGKTTLLDAITGFVEIDAGTVALDNERVEGWAPNRRAHAGLQRSFQSTELFDDLTVAENLLVSCERRPRLGALVDLVRPPAPRLSPAAEAAVEAFGLRGVLARRPPELPFGVRRLVSVARSLAAAPSLLLLDEPAAGLSEEETAELGTRIRGLADEQGLAIALVEHDMALVLSICDRVLVLDAGRTLSEGAPEDVAVDPQVVAAYLGDEAYEPPHITAAGR